jgi:RimJ/RimL family protein N-acetyltransferase
MLTQPPIGPMAAPRSGTLHAMPPLRLPTLTDGAITLRAKREADLDAIVAACQDPEIPHWTSVPSPYTRADARAFLRISEASARAGASADLIAVDEDDQLLGAFSLMELRRRPAYGEIGYWLAPWSRGRGVATRAVVLLRDWARAELGVTLIEILVHDDNGPSRRVAERAGFADTGEQRRARRDGSGMRLRVYAWRSSA